MQEHRSKILVGGGFLITIVIAIIVLANRGYGKVGVKTYSYAKALYAITNRQDESRLDKLAMMIDQSQDAGEVTEQEAKWLREIIEEAREGQWQTATAHARQLMEDQVE